MKKAIRLLGALIAVVLCFSGCGSTSSNLEVSDVREIKVENGQIHSMSPDGKLIMSMDNEKMYFYDTKNMDEIKDVDISDANGIDRASIQWSPNSKYITFTQDFYRLMMEPDIYVVSVEKGELDDITDDRVDKYKFTEENKKAKLDIFPMWTADSKNLLFTRIVIDGSDRETMLCQVDLSGDKEKEISKDSIAEGMTVVSLNPTSSAKKTYFTVMAPKMEDRHNGIWIVNNGTADQTDFESEDNIPAALCEVTANGEYGLAYYMTSVVPDANRSIYYLVKLKSGEQTPVIEDTGKGDKRIVGPLNAIFSPDDKKILYTYTDSSQKKYLAVKDIGGEDETVLWSKNSVAFAAKNGLFGPAGLYWAKNNTILITTPENTGYLVELK